MVEEVDRWQRREWFASLPLAMPRVPRDGGPGPPHPRAVHPPASVLRRCRLLDVHHVLEPRPDPWGKTSSEVWGYVPEGWGGGGGVRNESQRLVTGWIAVVHQRGAVRWCGWGEGDVGSEVEVRILVVK